MKIFFDPLQNKWSHRRPGKSYVWGKRRSVLPHRPFSPALSFSVRRRGRRIGPLIGLLTSPGRSSFAGNRKTFRRIHRTLQKRGGIFFVFTPQDVERTRIKGYLFNEKGWVKTDFPYPDVVYNRVPFRADEETSAVQSLLKRLESLAIPFFNAGFLDKWEMYQCLRQDPRLIPYLPDTRQFSKTELQTVLYVWEELYLKPSAGQKGDDMHTLRRMADGTIIHQSQSKTEPFPSFEKMWDTLKTDFEKKPYLLQKKINLMRFDGRPYDFRLMVQKAAGKWDVTGAGARLSGKDSITTHVPKGGELLALEELSPSANLDQLNAICTKAAEQLEKCIAPLSELSFDIGRDQNGQYWLFEANAKPMEFDETEIENKRMERLIDIFYQKSGF